MLSTSAEWSVNASAAMARLLLLSPRILELVTCALCSAGSGLYGKSLTLARMHADVQCYDVSIPSVFVLVRVRTLCIAGVGCYDHDLAHQDRLDRINLSIKR